MVTYFMKYFFTRSIQLRKRNVFDLPTMSKRVLQNLPGKKKMKPDQSSTNPTKNKNLSTQHNLDTATMIVDDKLQLKNQENSSCNTEHIRPNVTYLETPIKSANDKKEYRVVKLPNGLTALLIADLSSLPPEDDKNEDAVNTSSSENEETDDEESDGEEDDESGEEDDEEDDESDNDGDREESSDNSKKLKREEKMAACGLCVGVGSFSDPLDIQGMAHFLEHMVFMGSEKYTKENDFDMFIKKRGGYDNASTDCERTTFYFEVQEKHLLPALDRFAQFFIKPLMKKDAIAREREAVESEFQMALPSDACRKEQLFSSFARPNHPVNKFNWGNLVTLRDNVTDEKLYEELHKFRERHYSAHRMKLAIQARLPLDVLENYVVECFGSVPNNGLPPDDFTPFNGADSFDTPSFRRIYKIKPIKDLRQVDLTWAMPPLHDLYKSKPQHYISWIIGYEGKGSLISYLRKKMWCLGIYADSGESDFEHSSMYSLFTISLMLTEEGHNHLQEVLDSVFSCINLLRREGPQQRIADVIKQIREMSFRFADEIAPAEYVEDLCQNMHYYPPCHYIAGPILSFEYNPEAIRTCLNYLTPANVNIIIVDKKFNDEEFDKVEPWFNTRYTDTEIPRKWVERWETIEPFPELHLPLQNPFLTDDFTLIQMPPEVPKYPVKIYSDKMTELWYRPDPKFSLPESYMYFYIILPTAVSSLKGVALMDLYVNILKQLLIEETYAATVAYLNHEITANDKGIILKVYGFSQKLPLLLMVIAECIANSPQLITKDLFEVMKEEQIRTYYNTFVKPKKLVRDVRLSTLMLVHWTAMDRHAAISGVGFEEFQHFAKYMIDHIYVQSLIQGNMTEENTIKHVCEFIRVLKSKPLLPNTMPRNRVVQIPLGSQYCKVKNFNSTDSNSVVVNYYESGATSMRLLVIIELLIMIMEEPLFNQLRTQEQLGYDVGCILRETIGVLGYSVVVYTQADKYSTEHVDNRIEVFLEKFKDILQETSEADVGCVKEALTKQKQQADIHLREEIDRNWGEIISREYMFDRVEKELSMIEHITVAELREWMKNHTINGSNLRKLSVHVVGAPKTTIKENDQDMEMHENAPEHDLNQEETGNVRYSLNYIPTNSNDKSAVYITNIEQYKSQLFTYPAK